MKIHRFGRLLKELRHPKIGARLIIQLLLASIFGFLAISFYAKFTIQTRLNRLETTQIDQNIAQLNAYLEEQKHLIKTKTFGWSYWDDSYYFIDNFNQNFINRNLDPASLIDYGVSSITYLRTSDLKSYSVAYEKSQRKPDEILAKKMVEFLKDTLIHNHIKGKESYETYIRVNNKILVVGVAPVLMSDKTGEIKGIMAIARQIQEADIEKTLQSDTNIDFVRTNSPVNVKIYDDYAAISVGINGHDELPIGRLTTNYVRHLNAVKNDLMKVLALGILILWAAIIVFFYEKISGLVIAPLQSLSGHLTKISKTGDLTVLNVERRDDEIGLVLSSFNEMIVKIAALQETLSQKSFQIGKAQSEIDVIHNVKNALSPIATILSRMDELNLPVSSNFERAIKELADNATESARREKLSDFALMNLKSQIAGYENSKILVAKARESVNKAIETIESLRAKQNSFEDEFCEITSIIDHSLELARHNKDAVNIEFVKPPPQIVKGSKIIYSQVFDNLITNALEAMKSVKNNSGLIKIEIVPCIGEFENMIRVKINDNGDGFEKATRNKLFERGYSTRTHKKGGLGLHWCANNVNAMGGKLSIESEGKQKGALVTLDIPLAA